MFFFSERVKFLNFKVLRRTYAQDASFQVFYSKILSSSTQMIKSMTLLLLLLLLLLSLLFLLLLLLLLLSLSLLRLY